MNTEDALLLGVCGLGQSTGRPLVVRYPQGARAQQERSDPDGAWGPRKDSLQEGIPEASLQEPGGGGNAAWGPGQRPGV